MEGLEQMSSEGISIGSTTALIAEANDAGAVDGTTIADGESGSVDFPHGTSSLSLLLEKEVSALGAMARSLLGSQMALEHTWPMTRSSVW